MVRRIVIEVKGEAEVTEKVIRNIEATAIGQVAASELDVFRVHKEFWSGKATDEIQLPKIRRRNAKMTNKEYAV